MYNYAVRFFQLLIQSKKSSSQKDPSVKTVNVIFGKIRRIFVSLYQFLAFSPPFFCRHLYYNINSPICQMLIE